MYATAHRLGLSTLCSLNVELQQGLAIIPGSDLGVEHELHALLGQSLLNVLADLSVHAWSSDLAQELNNSDLRAQSAPDTAHLQTNDTTANDNHLLWHLFQGNGAGGCDDILLVDCKTWEWCALGAGRDDDVLSAHARLAAIGQVNSHSVFIGEGTRSLEIFHVVLLEQKFNAFCQTVDGSVLCLHHLLQVELDVADLDSAVFGVVEDLVVQVRIVEEGFGGNAADIQTCPA